MPFDLSDFIVVFLLVVALLLSVWGVIELIIKYALRKSRTRAQLKQAFILSNRLEAQRKQQLLVIKEHDAADSDLFDKVEEYRNDFGGTGEAR